MKKSQKSFSSLKPAYFAIPAIATAALLISWNAQLPALILLLLGSLLIATVFVAVHHAEVVALKVGEPFGSLILAVAVTVIEVGMIIVLILDSPETANNLPRDTVFSAVMITTNGIVGAALLVKVLRRKVANFKADGVSGAVATLSALSVLSLVLPSVTTSSPGPTFNTAQLAFAAVTSLVLYLVFVLFQTIRHRDYFLPPVTNPERVSESSHIEAPSAKLAWFSFAALFVSLVAVVGLAKVTSPLIKSVVDDLGFPEMVVAVSIALVVLLPESVSAVRAAYSGRTQTSLNLAYGSALASIGLTIPVIAVISIVFDYQVNLGLNPSEITLLFLTLVVSALTVMQGKATLMQAAVHLSIFGSFLLVVFTP
ncbi:calcium:proton antiporter [Candidatus Rhodoluna planktonica]|uniref:Ionic transporter y4hA n=1 Tax=Candidatus Rhodoluna planktonica TaxID=535712 RepID=A0A1D9DY10_9MICO|nr:ionic transporter y4hA [Candidatus Rhodoluna planktonica]AOY55689.1 ionic transporter y4hA [Candidatus Rhodoluna planktonica]